MANIIINPEYLKLIEEIRKLKQDIVNLYEERDELLYHTCRNIETEYISKIGILEYKAYEYVCKVLRLKRKIELYQISINRQEIPSEEDIEKRLDAEYKEYEEKLNDMFTSIQEALNRKNYERLTEEESQELKKLYRKLVKKLHPDLTKENSEEKQKILLQVIKAYENGDLEALRNLELLTAEIVEKDNFEIGEIEELKAEKEKYQNTLKVLLEDIRRIKESFPYNKKEFLQNDILLQKRKDELNIKIEQYKKIYREFKKILKDLKGEING